MAWLHPIMRSFGSLLNRLFFLCKRLWTMSSGSCFCTPSFLALERNSFASTPSCIRQNLRTFSIFQAKLRICLNLLFYYFPNNYILNRTSHKDPPGSEHLIAKLHFVFNTCYLDPMSVRCQRTVIYRHFFTVTSRPSAALGVKAPRGGLEGINNKQNQWPRFSRKAGNDSCWRLAA